MKKLRNVEIFGFVAGIVAIAGVVLNNHRLVECFWLWMVSNAICAGIHLRAGLYSMAAKDIVFLVLAIDGLIRWTGAG